MLDLLTVPESQLETHERLLNWARWCRSSGGRACLSIWRGYRPEGGYVDLSPRSEVDSRDALAVQKCMAAIPQRNRLALGYWYVFPGRNLHRMLRELAVNRDGLAQLVSDGRVMVRNLA